MNDEEFKSLSIGDIILHKAVGSRGLVVTGTYGDHVTAVRTVDVSNPIEWDIVRRANYEKPKIHQ